MTLNFSQFCDNWPETRKDQFSYHGKKALFEYIERLEEDTGEETEFDPIALCCEYTEYSSALDAYNDYNTDTLEGDEDETETQARAWLEDRASVIDVEGGGIIIAQF